MYKLPLVGLVTDMVRTEPLPYYKVYGLYVDAVLSLGAVPVLIPAVGDRLDVARFLERIDGLVLPGSVSNVGPELYGSRQELEEPVDDGERDATTLPLIRLAIEAGTPVLGICRGFQEMNVALGGTLHQQLDRMPGKHVHQFTDCSVDQEFAPSHDVSVMPGSWLKAWTGHDRITVNSAHNQAIDRLAPGLAVESMADDGTIEAVRALDSSEFAYGVQWHPEYRFQTNPVSQALFQAFGEAVQRHSAR